MNKEIEDKLKEKGYTLSKLTKAIDLSITYL